MAEQSNEPPLIVVVGETASGKSALALMLAERHNGEIICADSRTIYKGMDIGTAKPSQEERLRIRHHLLDVVAPGEPFTVVDFQQQAFAAIKDITSRGKLPIIVGGTGLYVDAIVFNYQFSAKADEQRRQELATFSIEELQRRIVAAGYSLPANDKNPRHLIRVLERGETSHIDRSFLRNNTLILGVQVARNVLRTRIEQRVEKMFRQGLRKEIDELLEKYGWEGEALTGIGYREFRDFYSDKSSMGGVKRRIVQDTLQLAKRQRTWFKRNRSIKWVADQNEADQLVTAFLTHTQV